MLRSAISMMAALLACAAGAAPVLAGDAQASGQAVAPDFHDQLSPDLVVTAAYARDRLQSLAVISVLQGADLGRSLRPGLGDMLAQLPGVSASSFGPAASRPILRGQQGERALVLTDGIGAFDASSSSADHAVVINSLLAERIEVLRGPEVLRYGSSTIGGLVNVIDRRIPRAVPDEPLHLQGLAGYGSAAHERSGSMAADLRLGGRLVLHVDGSWLKTDDLKIGGHALSNDERRRALQSSLLPADQQLDADGHPLDFAGMADIRGKLPNSSGRNWTAGVGAAFIGDGGSFGLSYGHSDNFYAVPLRYATTPGLEQEAPRIDMVQDRIDARAEIDVDSNWLQSINFRFGYADYRHHELEEDGDIGTSFAGRGLESRFELIQQRGSWQAVTGGQYSSRNFDVSGEEASVPRNNGTEFSLFTLHQLDLDAWRLQAGARWQRSTRHALPAVHEEFFAGERRFSNVSASVGVSRRLADGWRLSLNLSRSARAPSAEELFANGPHGGTQTFEIGDPDFKSETSRGLEAVLRARGHGYQVEASLHASWFSSFIHEAPTGLIEDGLPVYRLQQGKARYVGAEIQGSVDLIDDGHMRVSADAMLDYVRATITDVGPAPAIPPLRLLGGLELETPSVDLRGEVEWVDRQQRVAAHETPTRGHHLVNAELTFRPWQDERPLSLTLSARNIFNANARRHSSLLKDFAPLAGRDIRLLARFNF